MNKKLTAVLATLCVTCASAGLAACGGGTPQPGSDPVTYTLNTDSFETTVVYGGEVDFDNLTVVGSDGTTVTVTAEMVTGIDTTSVGGKTLTVSYAETTMTVGYTVKYEIVFVSGSQSQTQYVLSASEIQIPDGFDADDWTPAIPDTLTGNMVFTKKMNGDVSSVSVDFVTDGVLETVAGAGAQALAVQATSGSTWDVTASNDNVTVTKMGGSVVVTANKAGVTTVTVTATLGGDTATATKTVVVKPTEFVIAESGASYGIEGVRTIGRTDVRDNVVGFPLTLGAGADVGNLNDYVVWESTDGRATVDGGVITLGAGTGAANVSFTAKFVVEGETYATTSAFTARCVFDGVNVSNYEDLWTATKASKIIVLGANISFPTSVSDIHYDTMHTTYDDTFYKNINNEAAASIKTLLQFKNDLYGNGYVINAHNATLGLLDSTGALTSDSLFRGPLNFVALTQSGVSAVSVKGQDNVCFAVFEGVTINNVELRGCDLSAVNGEVDLTDLNYAGTTVEVFGDNVNVEYSRITNGRTVLRVFGDATDSTKVIHLNIKNSVLSGAREFIIRMGSNCFVDGTKGNESPYIDGVKKDLIATKKNYKDMTAAEKAAYEEAYIKTYVTLKNSVLKDAGIFAIGLDSHFAGIALDDGTQYGTILGEAATLWQDLAKTSYGSKLTLEGDVKLYNWKPLDQIDSSTLIEISESADLKDGWVTKLDFNIQDMVRIAASKEAYKSILTTHNSKDYVHAGIAFFGGGRNYSVFEDGTKGEGLGLEGFQVSLADVGKSFLTAAAGNEDFYFNLYDSTSSNFTPAEQDRLLASDEDAYACIYNKD